MATDSKEITIKGLILFVQNWIKYLLSKWIIILIAVVVCSVIGCLYVYYSDPKYTADLTFVLSSDDDVSSLASLAGQFGFDVGGNNDGAFSGDNIIQLLESEKMIEAALFTKVPGKDGCLLNSFINKTKILKSWQGNKYLKSMLPFPCDPNNLQPVQDSLIRELHDAIVNDYLVIDKIDKKLSYYKVSVTTPDQEVSVLFTNALVNAASKFYIDTKTKTAKQNLAMLQYEADSLRNLLGSSISSTAAESDRTFNLNPAFQVQRSSAQEGQFKTTVLADAYGEVVKNLEIAKITLQKSTPLYQIIDTPQLPLKNKKLGRLMGLIIGGFLGGVFIVFVLLFVKIYKDALSK